MIQKVEMYTVVCDNCKEEADYEEFSCYNDECRAVEECTEMGWHTVEKDGAEDLHYCDKCAHTDDNDEIHIKSERTKP